MELKKFEHNDQEGHFVFPDIDKEKGEILRVAHHFSPENPEPFARAFLKKAKQGEMVELTEDMWSELENTDSFDISKGGFAQVKKHADSYNKETGANRNWQDLKQKMDSGQPLDAPIILKYIHTLHLVSGNTRLMVARASGKTPKVLLVEMEDIH